MLSDLLKFITNYKKVNIPYLTIFKTDKSIIEMPKTDNPYIYIIVSGSIRLHTPSGIMDYISGQYSVSAIDTPTKAEVITFSDSNEFAAIAIEFSFEEVISVILHLDNSLPEQILNSNLSDEVMDNADKSIIDTVTRLLSMNESKEQLADKTNMSISSFHQKFKSAVGMGPLQCQKRLRLTEARRLMLDGNISVTDAALNVGYESVSQFIRDYKKMFTASPKEDIEALKNQLNQ